jgi:hypothetical protein
MPAPPARHGGGGRHGADAAIGRAAGASRGFGKIVAQSAAKNQGFSIGIGYFRNLAR